MFVCPDCGHSQPSPGPCPSDQTALLPRGDDAILGTSVGVYRIAKLLGVGGMGRVYKGVHPQIGSRVAVKVLSRECADRADLVERFFSEARAVNLIRHESIVNVLDLSQLPDGRPYIIMEYLDGAPLADLVEKRGPLPLGGMARLMAEALDALGAAHAKGIVHRDLKPDNIYVTPGGRPKVLDFGIAKLRPELGGSATQTGSLLGTPHYMSPEQALGKPVDLRTDIYAMGVILFECATGRKPFSGESLFDLLRKHIDEAPPPPHLLRPDMPPLMEQVILRALAKDPNQRFGSAADLAHALMASTQQLGPDAWTTVSPASLARMGAGGGAWTPTPGSWPGPTPMPLPGGPTTPGGPPMMHGGTPMPHYQGAPSHQGGSYPPPSPSMASAAGQMLPQAQAPRSNKVLIFALAGLALVGGGVAAAVVVGGGSSSSSTPAAGTGAASGSAVAVPTVMAGSGVGTGTDISAGIDDRDVAGQLDKLEKATAELEKLSANDIAKLTGAAQIAMGSGSGSGSGSVTGSVSGSGSGSGSVSGSGSASGSGSSTAKPTPTPTPLPSNATDLDKKVAAYSSGEPICDDYVRLMYAASKCDKLASSADSMRNGALAIMPSFARVAQMDAATRQTAVDGCAQGASGLRTMLKQFACAYPPAPKNTGGTTAGGTPQPDPDPPLAIDKPYNIRISGWNPSAFDFMAWLPSALAEAKKVLPDAQLTRIDADGVGPDGKAHLKISDDFQVLYRFVSQTAAKTPPDHPKGVKWEPLCMVQIYVEADEVMVIPMKGFGCDKPIAKPKCDAKEIWAKAIAKGAPGTNAYASLWYGYAGGKWSFSIEGDFSDTFIDGC